MRITLIVTIFLSAFRISHAQLKELNFVFQSLDPGCNPFKDKADNFRFDSKWQVYYGTPEVKDYYNDLFYNVGKLRAEKSSTGVEKAEGLYVPYDFKCNHSYDITIAARQGEGDPTGFRLIAKKSVTPKANSTCGLDSRPADDILAGDEAIFVMFPAYDGPFGAFNGITIPNFRPDKDLAYLMLESNQPYINANGEIYVSYVTILDKGITRSDCPGPTGSEPSDYPPITGLEVKPDYISLANDANQWDFLWDPFPYPDGIDEDRKGYQVWVNNSRVWDNYDDDGDIFIPERSAEGKIMVNLPGLFCRTSNFKVQALESSGAPNSRYTASSATWIWKDLANRDIVLNTFVLPPSIPSIPSEGIRIIAISSVALKDGFKYSASENGGPLQVKAITSCSDYLANSSGRIATSENRSEFSNDNLQSKNFYFILPRISETLQVNNPVNNLLRVKGLDPKLSYTFNIFNLEGNSIYSAERYFGLVWEVDTETLPRGLYLLKITSRNRTEVFKILKQ